MSVDMMHFEGWHHYMKDENIHLVSWWKDVMYQGMDTDVGDEML